MSTHQKPELRVTAFSDYICPFCYIGFLRLEKLRANFDLKVNWCFLEIHPDTPSEGQPVAELGYSDDQWMEMMEELGDMAREEGVRLRGQSATTNSHKALLLGEAAKSYGKDAFYFLHKRLFEAYLCEQKNIGDPKILKTLAFEAGISAKAVEQAWDEPKYELRLKQNLKAAVDLRVNQTPTVFIGERKLVGALASDTILRAAHEAIASKDNMRTQET
jgi:predicted DsbA family dithiol-disulfide isomerase